MLSVGIIVLLLLLITLCVVVAITWSSYPIARYIKISRADSDAKYVAIGDIEVFDSNGNRAEFSTLEGFSAELSGPARTTAAAAADYIPFINNGVVSKGYMRETTTSATFVGPCMGGIFSDTTSKGYLIYVLSCKVKIAKINIRAVETDTAKSNLQNVKVVLLDNDRNPIAGSDKITPYMSLPRSVHHFTYG